MRARRCVMTLVVFCSTEHLAWAQDSSAPALQAEEEAENFEALSRSGPRRLALTHGVIDGSAGARFVFGASLPTITCAPLQLCDIELQAGEQVQGLHIGDQARWRVEAAASGTGKQTIQHVIVHPVSEDIRTFLVVTTDRRTYRMRLVADDEEFMTRVSFSYPEDAMTAFRRLAGSQKEPRAEGSSVQAPARHGSLQALSFAYEMEGDSPAWKPVRVYNDGVQTVIELPFAMRQTEAPALLVVRVEGGPLTDDEQVQVNYRVHGTRYVVDTVFDVADLMVGVGPLQQRVRIRRIR